MSAEPIGIYAEQVAKREAVVARLSPAARHQAFPKLYARPTPGETAYQITVNCKTGERVIQGLVLPPAAPVERKPHPRPVVRPPLPQPIKSGKLGVREMVAAQREGIQTIILVCARHWNVTPQALTAFGRVRIFARPRQAAMLLMRDLLGLSFPAIGLALGRRDHTTALDGARRAQELLETDAAWGARYHAALAELKGLKTAEATRAGAP